MRSSYRFGRFFDIDVRVHITFFLLPLFMVFSSLSQGGGLFGALHGVLLMLIVFAFVLMHEYGHALTARRFGIRTRSIMLYPIGGAALLESAPKKPWHQIAVAGAGPAVNLVVAAGLFGLMHAIGHESLRGAFAPASGLGALLASLLSVNLFLGLFNLIPALPMDGGKVLSGVLQLKLSALRAAQIASRVGKLFALAFGAYALYSGQLLYGLLALFVWSASKSELRTAEHHARTTGEGFTQVIGRTPWQRGGPPWGGQAPRRPGEVVEVVDGPEGPEVKIFRPREGSS